MLLTLSQPHITSHQNHLPQADIVTLGAHWTSAFLKHFGLLCPSEDVFIPAARRRILDFRSEAANEDPVSRSIFHRAQCAWQLQMQGLLGEKGWTSWFSRDFLKNFLDSLRHFQCFLIVFLGFFTLKVLGPQKEGPHRKGTKKYMCRESIDACRGLIAEKCRERFVKQLLTVAHDLLTIAI